ncbi:MAG: hypothetical protein ABW007_10055 [Chitinophagaceae bacterium]
MQLKDSYLTRPENVRFIRVWWSMWTHARLRWLDFWSLFCELREQDTPLKIRALPESIARWCPISDGEGRERPLIMGAAAGLRREFLRMVAMALPEEGIEQPRCSDLAELTIANSPIPEHGVKIALDSIVEVKELLSRVRPEWNIGVGTELENVLGLLEQEFEARLRQLEELGRVKRKKIVLRPLAESGYILVQADRINKATVEAFAYGAMRPLPSNYLESLGPDATFWLAHKFGSGQPKSGRDYLVGAIGFKEEPAQRVQRLLQRNGALAIKAQYALWARAYAETDATPGVYITLSITQFCDDIGLARHNGVHRPENKLAAMAVLELLTSMELICIYRPPQGPIKRIRGPIWSRGMISEELRGYEDVFEGGNRPLWVPKAFSYAPGPFFANDTWRAYNHYIALVGEGLLKLNSNNADKYAVMVGGYLAILARMNGYRRCRVGLRTILERTGLWAVDRRKNPGRMRKKLEDALDRLIKVGVIKSWDITASRAKEEIDWDNFEDEKTLEKMAEPHRWLKDWLKQVVVVDWPMAMKKRELILKEKKAQHAKAAIRRKGSTRKTA